VVIGAISEKAVINRAGTFQSRTCGQYRLSLGVEAVLAAQFCGVRFGTASACKSRFIAIGLPVSYPLEF
jgi:hypothetical protein